MAELLLDADRGNLDRCGFGYTVWTFWPSKTHNYLYEEVQKVFTNDLSQRPTTARGWPTLFTQELEEGLGAPGDPRDAA